MKKFALLVCALALPATLPAAEEPPATREPAAQVVEVKAFAGPEQTRLPCNRGTPSALCNLRIYQIMVEAFIDGDANANYGTGYGTSHHRGDLQGIIDSLDYIKSLGVNALWLTPIFETVAVRGQNDWSSRLDATGYYTTNYFRIDPKFGTDRQFQTLVDEVHKRDMYIFLDGTFGHYKSNIVASPSGFKPVNREKCLAGSPGQDWYPNGGLRQACADHEYADTRDFFNEVIGYWIQNYRIDGWRLDQAYQVPLEQWREYRATAERVAANTRYRNSKGRWVNPPGYLVAEIAWRQEPIYNAKAYGSNEQPALASAFEFFLRDHLVATLAMDEVTERGNQPASWLAKGFSLHDSYPDHAMPNLMIGNHDQVRFGDLIQRAGLGNPTDDAYWDRHKAAFTFLAAYSGPITIYYGEEIAQELPGYAAKVVMNCAIEGECEDHVARTSGRTDNFNERQLAMKNRVSRLMELRSKNPALAVGSRTHVHADDSVYIDLKKAGKNQILLMMNTRGDVATVRLRRALIGNPPLLKDLLDNTSIKADGEDFVIQLPALSARLLRF